MQRDYFFVDRPSTPVFVPEERKVDKETQIGRLDRELFSFDQSVEPLLEVLVAKSINQAQVEIFEEDRASRLALKAKRISVRQRAHSLRVQQQLYRRSRYQKENDKRRRQRSMFYAEKLRAHRKLYAKQFVKDKVRKGLFLGLLAQLESKRVIGKGKTLQVEKFFRRKVVSRGEEHLAAEKQKARLIAKMLREASKNLGNLHGKTIAKTYEEKALQQQAEREKREREAREKVERERREREKAERAKVEALGKKLIREMRGRALRSNLREHKAVQSLSLWKQGGSAGAASQFDVFGLGLNSLVLLLLRGLARKKKERRLETQEDHEAQAEVEARAKVEAEVGRELVDALEKLFEKWPKTFPQFKFEVPVSARVEKFFEQFERVQWEYLSMKEVVINSKWPLESPKLDFGALEKAVLAHLGQTEGQAADSMRGVEVEDWTDFMSGLEPPRRKELILSYFFNTDNKKTVLLSNSRVKAFMENISRADDFCKSQRLGNFLCRRVLRETGLGPVEQFLVEEHLLTPRMWQGLLLNVFKVRIALLKKAFQGKIKQYKQDLKARNSQLPKDEKGERCRVGGL